MSRRPSYLTALRPTHFQPPGGTWRDEDWPAHHEAMKAAQAVARTYTMLYTRRGMVTHMAPPFAYRSVLCTMAPRWPEDWLGTGGQDEYELAAELPTCKRCYELFMAAQRCGNPECPCQNMHALLAAISAGAA